MHTYTLLDDPCCWGFWRLLRIDWLIDWLIDWTTLQVVHSCVTPSSLKWCFRFCVCSSSFVQQLLKVHGSKLRPSDATSADYSTKRPFNIACSVACAACHAKTNSVELTSVEQIGTSRLRQPLELVTMFSNQTLLLHLHSCHILLWLIAVHDFAITPPDHVVYQQGEPVW